MTTTNENAARLDRLSQYVDALRANHGLTAEAAHTLQYDIGLARFAVAGFGFEEVLDRCLARLRAAEAHPQGRAILDEINLTAPTSR